METLSVCLPNYMGRKWVSFLRDKGNKMINSDLLKENIFNLKYNYNPSSFL
jgi:hypothetical protein